MKSLLSGNQNAMLLVSYRMRMRPASVLSAVSLLTIILAFTVLYATIVMSGDFVNAVKEILMMIYICQSLVLLFGAVKIGASVLRERTSGTLDFHRVSPQSRLAIVMGLLIGTPALECILASLLFPGVLLLGLLAGFPLLDLMIYECALVFSMPVISLFLIVCVLLMSEERLKATGFYSLNGMAFLILYAMIFAMPSFSIMGSIENNYSACYYAFSPYFLFHMPEQVFTQQTHGIWLPTAFGIQLAVQIPLIVFGVWLAVRRLIYPDRQILSKAQAYAVACIAFGLYWAELINNFEGLSRQSGLILSLIPLTGFVGLFGAFMISPSHLLVNRGKNMRSGGKLALWWHDMLSDSASCFFWLIGYSIFVYLVAVSTWFACTAWCISFPFSRSLLFLLMSCGLVLAQVAFWGGFYEVFLLGRFHRNVGPLAVFVLVLCIVVPLFGAFLEVGSTMYWGGQFFSPIITPIVLVLNFLEDGFTGDLETFLWSGITINLVFAFVFFVSVARLRRALK